MSVSRRAAPPDGRLAAQESNPGSPLRPAPDSLLGVDVGAVFTKAALFEPVEGQYRLIAAGLARTSPSTHVFDGLALACQPIERLTGRQLFRAGELLSGEVSGRRGVEILAASVTCQRPLRVLATNDAAARLASGERCAIERLVSGPLRAQVQQMAAGRWDAIVGSAGEVGAAAVCFGSEHHTNGTQAARGYGPAIISGEAGAMRSALRALALDRARQDVAGLPDLAAAATEPLTTGPAAMLGLTKLIASRFGLRLAIADHGASQTMLSYASPDQEWLRLTLHEQVLAALPATTAELRALHQDIQRRLRLCAEDGFSADLLLGTGSLARFQNWAQPALTLLDGVQPSGVIQFALDTAAVVSQIAPFAQSLPDVACRIFEQDGLTGLGASVCPRGSVKAGTKAIEVRWKSDDQADQTRSVKAGELVRIPLPAGVKASLSLFPSKPVDVGLNRPGVAATAQVDGGRVGLIVDARFESDSSAAARDRWEAALT